MSLTTEQRRRVIDALCETDRFIAKESLRNPNTRPADMQKCLESYIGHRAKLLAMLAE
jgi:hypothetical protein